MIPIHPSIRNSKSTNSLSLKPLSNRTGSSFSNTINGNMVNLSNQFSVAMVNPFLKTPSALYAVLLTILSMITMVARGNTNAKSVLRPSLPARLLQHLSDLPALIVVILWLQKKTVNSSAFINV